jgi:hypothetical protein
MGDGGMGGGGGCVPATCDDLADADRAACGVSPDGCGGMVECGTCDGVLYCQTEDDGISRCNAPVSTCTPKTHDEACADIGGKTVCGSVSDGCESTIDCGATCEIGVVCGSGGTGPNGVPIFGELPTCSPTTCEAEGVVCGSICDVC